MKRFSILMAILAICLPMIASSDAPPTYQGLVCMGWVKPEAQALDDGEASGQELVVNTDLSESEKQELYYARAEEHAAMKKESAVEEKILNHHHLLFPLSNGSEWMRVGPCGDTPMIRLGEYHITQFVPSNPKYPGDGNWTMKEFYHQDPQKCRAYFSEMRKRAVKAKYDSEADDKYVPMEQPK